MITTLASSNMITPLDLAPVISYNANLAHPLFVALLSTSNPDTNLPSPFLDILPYLPPTLPTFDLMGKLLQDPTPTASGHTTIAEQVRTEALGRFILESINWLEEAEQQEQEGLVSDDRFAKGVQHVSSLAAFSFLTNTNRFHLALPLLLRPHQIRDRRPRC